MSLAKAIYNKLGKPKVKKYLVEESHYLVAHEIEY